MRNFQLSKVLVVVFPDSASLFEEWVIVGKAPFKLWGKRLKVKHLRTLLEV